MRLKNTASLLFERNDDGGNTCLTVSVYIIYLLIRPMFILVAHEVQKHFWSLAFSEH